ncbi:hypothetical protein SPRG_16050 [Saprolegnia parasitica CBS 223.65]|uniref:Phosphatidylinositol N-acetylglucosaminyltransferase subunit Y n=1 Tax=Saprolegnia parasitica (strain CBS 223.65) TaxID=695850 RepID=A0A067BPD6_SAPPC|nr:hypothetical protein SPRG_16050 [Saprolegnia parasitica CBS 223.65]KDO18620.1 hypothetical protein SPRG_16050 [Saprolegnia parasitica CBS 223.65]|eukprot:XP_012210666.1 hypothetical protein SPRG_16050 [Saprolegnia parasitica CBS 223.65]
MPPTRTSSAIAGREGARIVSTGAIWGYVIVGLSFAFFMTFLYLIVVAKLLPPSDDPARFPMMETIRQDHFYCYLIPLTIPAGFIAMYINWVSLKYFRHN